MIELPIIDAHPTEGEAPRDRYWRSINHLENTDQFRKMSSEEFLPGASDTPSGASRRQFLQIMGASMALAGLTACRRPIETIVPFAHMPEDTIPGVPIQYATSMPFRGVLRPLLVESFDGRPTKIEGNPEHADSLGKTGVYEQASILSLYDPDRLRSVSHGEVKADWSVFKDFALQLSPDSRVAVLSEASSSMTFAAVRRQLEQRFSSVNWVTYGQAVGNNTARGTEATFGRAHRGVYDLANAEVIVSLDSDFLGSNSEDPVSSMRGFAAGRDVDSSDDMSRLYVIESDYSITGGMADNRLRLKSSEISSFAAALAAEMGVYSGDGGVHSSHAWINEIASDLRRAGSAGLVVAGSNQPVGVHALAAAINAEIGAVGTTVTYLEVLEDSSDQTAALSQLMADMSAGAVDLVLTLGVNPVYEVAGFGDAYQTVVNRIHLSLYDDETARLASWTIPQTHYLEEWGDGRSQSGYAAIIQPLIAPLYEDAHSSIELVGLLGSASEQFGYDLVRATWRERLSGNFDKGWRLVVHDGFEAGSAYDAVSVSASASGIAAAATDLNVSAHEGIEVVVSTDPKVFDGRFANNAWLQELPDPTTKVVWDNVAKMNPATAERLGLGYVLDGGQYFTDTVRVEANGQGVVLPVWVQPGLADDSVQISLGYGREVGSEREERETNFFDLDDFTDVYGHGAISTGVGANTAPLATGGRISSGAVTKSGSGYLVASTQDHGALQEEGRQVQKRGLFRMATVEEYRANPKFVAGGEPTPIREDWEDYPTIWEKSHPKNADYITSSIYHDNQWGMVIDLNTCTGCNACVVACQAENNVQVVGKDQVSRGREMQWIRMDRYFVSGDGDSFDDPQMVMQPLPCQHCENAPCEEVCPVAATVHSPDGTNQMIYNRCIGTRYCANNCPYKVRRFNFYNWTKTLPETIHMAQNPNVTVRSRGVMEKCSFCIQRIRGANKTANLEDRSLTDGEVVTACQQVCPANAITFGNLADSSSAVSQKRMSDRRYELLAELSVKPRVSYLGRIRNPNANLT